MNWGRNCILLAILFALAVVGLPPQKLQGFALMGPYADWMARTNTYRIGWDVGGPVDISEGYRWNVPVLTYGFDQSFLDYFGSNGVKAVEQAFQMINDLPAASHIVLTNNSTTPWAINFQAASQRLFDLKTATLALLVEQLGLAEPNRSMFVLQQWSPGFLSDPWLSDWPESVITNYIVERNFDPQTLAPSHYVNNFLFTGEVIARLGPFDTAPWLAWADAYAIDPLDTYVSALADLRSSLRPILDIDGFLNYSDYFGAFATTLSQDDLGGLKYLLNTNNVNVEALLPDVLGAGTNSSAYVDVASRPGIEKITFVRQPYDPLVGRFSALTNQFTDTFITNGTFQHQQLERVTIQPDFLFSAADISETNGTAPYFVRTGTENWWNSAVANRAVGPGVIRPPVQITFNKLGPCIQTDEWFIQNKQMNLLDIHWASFDNSTNPIVVYPQQLTSQTNGMIFRLLIPNASATNYWDYRAIQWVAPVPVGSHTLLQTSTNMNDWVTLGPVTNRGTTALWRHYYDLPARYFRALPQ